MDKKMNNQPPAKWKYTDQTLFRVCYTNLETGVKNWINHSLVEQLQSEAHAFGFKEGIMFQGNAIQQEIEEARADAVKEYIEQTKCAVHHSDDLVACPKCVEEARADGYKQGYQDRHAEMVAGLIKQQTNEYESTIRADERKKSIEFFLNLCVGKKKIVNSKHYYSLFLESDIIELGKELEQPTVNQDLPTSVSERNVSVEEKLICRQCRFPLNEYYETNWGQFCSEPCANKYANDEGHYTQYGEWKSVESKEDKR